MCEGDFNGDGLTDVAVILVGNKEWKLAIFHQSKSGFGLVHSHGSKTEGADAIVPSPQLLSLKLLRKGKPYIYTFLSHTGSHEKRYAFKTDVIEFSASERFSALLYCKNGKYETIEFNE